MPVANPQDVERWAGAAPASDWRDDVTDDDVAAAMVPAFREMLAKFPQAKKSEVCSALMIASLNALRKLDGDEWVLGFLESAVKDLKASAPLPILSEAH